jgi:protein-tyrosine phosphatase
LSVFNQWNAVMPPPLYLVASDLPGRLFIMPRPDGERLTQDVAHYRSLGVDTIVSMLPPDEARALSLQNEAQIAADTGLDFINFPIQDFGLPDPATFGEFVKAIAIGLGGGTNMAIHCRAGIGRSGMAVCCVLQSFGHSAIRAIKVTSQARGKAVPDTVEQRAFIENFARTVKIDQ